MFGIGKKELASPLADEGRKVADPVDVEKYDGDRAMIDPLKKLSKRQCRLDPNSDLPRAAQGTALARLRIPVLL